MRFTLRAYRLIIFASLAFLILASVFSSASPRSEARLHGTVIEPADKIAWPPEKWQSYMVELKDNGLETVMIAWSSRNGRSVYPSDFNSYFYGQGTADVVGLILEAADELGQEVYLGLDGTVVSEEIHEENYEGPAERCQRSAGELISRYGNYKSLKGFVIPILGSGIPKKSERTFHRQVAAFIHKQMPDSIVIVRVSRPSFNRWGSQGQPALFGIRQYVDLMDVGYEQLKKTMENDEFNEKWLGAWKKDLSTSGMDAILFSDGLGSMTAYYDFARYNLEKLREVADSAGIQLWVAADLFTLVREKGDTDPPYPYPISMATLEKNLEMEADYADRIVGFSFDYMNQNSGYDTERRKKLRDDYAQYLESFFPDAMKKIEKKIISLSPPQIVQTEPAAENVMLKNAMRVEENFHSRHDREGQVITYRNMLYHIDHPYDDWQEDACWLTGIYTAAESLRYAVTGSPEAGAYARRSWRALHEMAHVTPKPGIVVRVFKRTMYGYNPDVSHKKRWHKDPDREMYFIADISRDQLSGYFLGVAAYYDHVANEEEKRIIREDVDLIMRPIIEHDMTAVEFTGEPTTYGALDESPLLALNYLLVAYHITGKEEYRDKYRELVERRYLLNAIEHSATTFNHFFEHFDDSAYYHAIQYETDPEILMKLTAGLDFLYAKALPHGNGHLLFDVATYRPWTDAAAMGLTELIQWPVEQLYVGEWAAKPSNNFRGYVPIAERRPQEYMWCWFPSSTVVQGGPETEFAGIGYLLAYWMGRYHGVIH
ncbi:MAG: DUF4434 domain-containing protein [bacterium]